MKVKDIRIKIQADFNEYGIFNIPVWHCYKCNVLLHNKPSRYLSLPVIKSRHFKSIYDYEHPCHHWKADTDAGSTW